MTTLNGVSLHLGIGLRDAALTVLVALLSLYVFVLTPLNDMGVIHEPIMIVTFLFAIASGVMLGGRSHGYALSITVLGIALVPAELWRHASPSPFSITILNLLAAAFLVMLSITLIQRIMAPGRVNWHRILGAVAIYLSFGLVCAALYGVIEVNAPGAFAVTQGQPQVETISHMLHFSFVTLTSTGYGDILPIHPVARALCHFEAIVGQLFPAILIARLVSLAVREH